MIVARVASALGEHVYTQAELSRALASLWGGDERRLALLERFHRNAEVEARPLALSLEEHVTLTDFGARNDAFIRVGTLLGERAARGALEGAGIEPAAVDAIFFTTVTGIATPTIDARLAARLGLRPDVRRYPFFGLGCVGGAAGLARVNDFLRGAPDAVALFVAVEICSLTFQPDDVSPANFVASGLFADGAAAVVAVGEAEARRRGIDGPRVLATRSRLYPGTERTMGWDVGGHGFKVVLAPTLADLVREQVGADVIAFLDDHGIRREQIAAWICHPGGPKILRALGDALGLAPSALAITKRSLMRSGNLSSASVLLVFEDTLRAGAWRRGTPAVLLALGPGFCCELLLLER